MQILLLLTRVQYLYPFLNRSMKMKAINGRNVTDILSSDPDKFLCVDSMDLISLFIVA